MPKPILKDNNLVTIIKENINLLKEIDNKIEICFNPRVNEIILNSDSEQLSRAFFNLIKNSIESIQEKKDDISSFIGNIYLELNNDEGHINFIISDNGIGFEVIQGNIKDILNPYFTTKEKGTGLGLAIVNKIINDHNGSLTFTSLEEGAKIQIKFIK